AGGIASRRPGPRPAAPAPPQWRSLGFWWVNRRDMGARSWMAKTVHNRFQTAPGRTGPTQAVTLDSRSAEDLRRVGATGLEPVTPSVSSAPGIPPFGTKTPRITVILPHQRMIASSA